MTLPEVQEQLRVFAQDWGRPELASLADEMRRRSSGPRPAPVSQPMTEDLAKAIRALKAANPGMTQVEIARKCRVNQGRVSEVLKGKRS